MKSITTKNNGIHKNFGFYETVRRRIQLLQWQCRKEGRTATFGAKPTLSVTLYDSHLNTYKSTSPIEIIHSMAFTKLQQFFFSSSITQTTNMSTLDLHLDEPETYSDQAKQVFSTLQEYLQPRTKGNTLKSTAKSLLAMLPKDNHDSTEVWMFFELCITLAEQIPYNHSLQLKLVELIEHIHLSPQLSCIFEEHDSKVIDTMNPMELHKAYLASSG